MILFWPLNLDETFSEIPTYETRAGFIASNWTEVFSTYSSASSGWARIAGNFTWEELAAGPVPEKDIKGVRIDRSASSLLTRLRVGQANYVFDNFNGDYSPEAKPLVRPNQVITTKALAPIGSVHSLFSGRVTDIVIDPLLQRRTTTLLAEDQADALRKVVNTVLGINTKTSSLATEVLDNIGIDTNLQEVEAISDTIPFAYLDNIRAGDALDQIVKSGNHFGYVSGKGKFVLQSRDSAVKSGSVATYDNAFLGFNYSNALDSVFNDVRVSGITREATSVATVSWLGTVPSITSGSTISFFSTYLDPITKEATPVNSIVTPVSSADYQFNAAADGSGTDLTSQTNLAFTAFANSAFVEITNASSAGFLTKFQIRGIPLELQPPFLARSESNSSQNTYGRRVFGLESNLVNGFNFAKNYSDFIRTAHKNPKKRVSIQFKNEFPNILLRDLGDIVTVIEDNTALNEVVRIEQLTHVITFAGKGLEHVTEYKAANQFATTFNVLFLDKDPEGKLDSDRVLGF